MLSLLYATNVAFEYGVSGINYLVLWRIPTPVQAYHDAGWCCTLFDKASTSTHSSIGNRIVYNTTVDSTSVYIQLTRGHREQRKIVDSR